MSSPVVHVRGVLNPDGTLVLVDKPKLPPGPVEVSVQAVDDRPDGELDVIAVLTRIHAEQAARGSRPRTRAEIDAAIASMRDEDETRMQGIERLHEENQRVRD